MRTIKAIIRNGTIEPLGPLPSDWEDGRKLVVEEAGDPTESIAGVEAWTKDVEAAMAEIPSEDHDLFEAALAEHEKESKKAGGGRSLLRDDRVLASLGAAWRSLSDADP